MKPSTQYLFENSYKYGDVAKVGLVTARKQGLKFYWTDGPCKRGHIAFRYTSNGNCVQCEAERKKRMQNTMYRIRDENLGIHVNGKTRRAIEDKLLDMQLERELAW